MYVVGACPAYTAQHVLPTIVHVTCHGKYLTQTSLFVSQPCLLDTMPQLPIIVRPRAQSNTKIEAASHSDTAPNNNGGPVSPAPIVAQRNDEHAPVCPYTPPIRLCDMEPFSPRTVVPVSPVRTDLVVPPPATCNTLPTTQVPPMPPSTLTILSHEQSEMTLAADIAQCVAEPEIRLTTVQDTAHTIPDEAGFSAIDYIAPSMTFLQGESKNTCHHWESGSSCVVISNSSSIN
jgi:hypothetical protein